MGFVSCWGSLFYAWLQKGLNFFSSFNIFGFISQQEKTMEMHWNKETMLGLSSLKRVSLHSLRKFSPD